MFSRLFKAESQSVTGAAILISVTTLLSRLVGIVRDRTFAHIFGAGPTMDAYYAAFKIPDLIFNLLIAGALTAGFIPIFTKIFYETDDKSKAWQLVNNVITIVAIALLSISLIGIIFAPMLVKVIAPGFSGERLDLVIKFTRIMLFSPTILGISMVLGGVLQSLRQFLLYSLAPVFYNIGIILGATFLTKFFGVSGLAYGVVLGALLHLSLQTIGTYKNSYRWHWRVQLADKPTREIGRLMIPRTIGLAMTQINAVIITALASLLPLGSVTVYNYANNLQMVPAGLIGIPFALAVFPLLARKALTEDKNEFKGLIVSTARQIIFLIAPLSVCFLLLRAQIVRVLLGTGAFDWDATINTANALAFFSLSLFAQALIPLLARSFYAINNTKTPFVIGLVSEIVSIIAALTLMKPLGVAGLALASSIGALLNMSLLAIWLNRHLKAIIDPTFLFMVSKVATASILMGLATQWIKNYLGTVLNLDYFWGILSQGALAGILGLLIYGAFCRLFKVEEMEHFQASLRKKWFRIWNIGEGMDEAEKL